ncbi:unnamed protein product [Orchesella dallaii]|uniref:RING-type domain-containing protein n=1 Tax=Orchesella dallaii TaxID=48710 RepID=A0ABP1S2U9_9HEXA
MHRRQQNASRRFYRTSSRYTGTFHTTQIQIQEEEDYVSDSSGDIPLSALVTANGRNPNTSQENAEVTAHLLEDAADSAVMKHGQLSVDIEDLAGSKGDEIREHLECLICKNLLLPPITLCTNGHAFCVECKKAFRPCPTCVEKTTATRNLDKILPFCLVKCKNTDLGCKVILSGKEISKHHQSCKYRQFMCRKCSTEVPNELFLEHLRVIEKVKLQMTKECIFVFEIPDEELGSRSADVDGGKALPFWGPTWIHCYDNNFFCFLEHSQLNWWIWVGALAPKIVCNNFRCSITVRNKKNQTGMEYVGTIHPVHTPPNDIWKSAECLIFCDLNLKNFLHEGGIEVIVRIDDDYKAPRNCYGALVQPPTIVPWSPPRSMPCPFNIPPNHTLLSSNTGLFIPNPNSR